MQKLVTCGKGEKGEEQYYSASPAQQRLIWLCQEDLSQYSNGTGGIDQYNKSGTIRKYCTPKTFQYCILVSQSTVQHVI